MSPPENFRHFPPTFFPPIRYVFLYRLEKYKRAKNFITVQILVLHLVVFDFMMTIFETKKYEDDAFSEDEVM